MTGLLDAIKQGQEPLPEESGWYYGSVLPYRRQLDANGQPTGDVEWAVPRFARGLMNMMAPEHRDAVVRQAIAGDPMPAFSDAAQIGQVGTPIGMNAGGVGMFGGRAIRQIQPKRLASEGWGQSNIVQQLVPDGN